MAHNRLDMDDETQLVHRSTEASLRQELGDQIAVLTLEIADYSGSTLRYSLHVRIRYDVTTTQCVIDHESWDKEKTYA